MGEIGCYCMDLYCDFVSNSNNHCEGDSGHGYKEMPWNYTGPNRSYCEKQARKNGWLISRTKINNDNTRYCLCPKHSGTKSLQCLWQSGLLRLWRCRKLHQRHMNQ